MEISQNYVAFSEYMNFTESDIWAGLNQFKVNEQNFNIHFRT